MKQIKTKIIILALILLMSISIVDAESGIVTVNDQATYSTSTSTSGFVGGSTNFDQLRVDFSNWDHINEYFLTAQTDTSFLKVSNSTFFTISSGGTGSGSVYYTKAGRIIYWVFSSDTLITGNTITLSYVTNIFDANNIATTLSVYAAESVGGNIPVCLVNSFSSTQCANQWRNDGQGAIQTMGSTVSKSVSNSYNISYSNINGINKFYGNVSKYGTNGNTLIKFQDNIGTSYFSEPTFNTNSFTLPFITYQNGLYINATTSSGAHTIQLINSSSVTTTTTATATISLNKAIYNRSENVNISYISSIAGIIKIIAPDTTELFYSKSCCSGSFNSFIADNALLGNYTVQFVYNGFILDTKYYIVTPVKGLSEIQFNKDVFGLNENIYFVYYINSSNGYLNIYDSNNNLKANNTGLTINNAITDSIKLAQNSFTGIYTIKLYNSSGILLSSDTTNINYAVINQTLPSTIPSSTPSSLLDISNALSEVVIGKVTDDDGQFTDVKASQLGSKLAQTLLLVVLFCLLMGCWHLWKGKNYRR